MQKKQKHQCLHLRTPYLETGRVTIPKINPNIKIYDKDLCAKIRKKTMNWNKSYCTETIMFTDKWAVMFMIILQNDLQLPMQSYPAHGEMYSIQYYVIMHVSDLRQICGFLRTMLKQGHITLDIQITGSPALL